MTKLVDLDEKAAEAIVEQLRGGSPPQHSASAYSAGYEDFLGSVRRRHLESDPVAGKIRFIHGSWGSGKTHFFRLLTEEAVGAGWLVSSVELSAQETPFNKFELVLFSIIRNIAPPESLGTIGASAPFGNVLRSALDREAGVSGDLPSAVQRLSERLFSDPAIDIDVKRVVRAYWETFAGESQDERVLEERRGMLLQWFAGESHKTTMRNEFGIQKAVSKENARTILTSLTALIQLLGFKGLLVLFDESEMTHSTMSKSNLKQAHNNLLYLLNETGQVPGLFLLYAAVPEFFTDPKTGVLIYGALAARIGTPPGHPPKALDKVWNLDAEKTTDPASYEDAALKIRRLYEIAYPGDQGRLLSVEDLRRRIGTVVEQHGPYERTSRWRVVIKETTKLLDLGIHEEELPEPAESYRETVSFLKKVGDD
ncbi:BREX system ATP-binding domain-containing protein [Kribbella sp. NPDC023972]|uniref:BREX system ATP-binding domain-containing protein n=1 Tax=Kribbella sp. NPDC023972 TaxID=3154795 RepID=UPI0033E9F651